MSDDAAPDRSAHAGTVRAGLLTLRPVVAASAIAIVALTIVLLIYGRSLLAPIAVAIVVWHLINALAGTYRSLAVGGWHLPSWLCLAMSLLTIFAALGFIIELIRNNVAQVSAAAPIYQANLQSFLESTYQHLGLKQPPSFARIIDQINAGAVIGTIASTLGGLAGNTGIVIIYVLFMLVEQRSFDNKLRALVPDPDRAARARQLLGRIGSQIQGYLWIKTLMSALTGGVCYAILWSVGVDFAAFWGLVIFLLNYIPTIGSLLGVGFPVLLALVQFQSPLPSLVVLATLGFTQFVIGNLLEPRLMGRTLNLSPLVILISLALWGSIWGVVGMILCVPITVIIMIVCAHFEATRPIAILLSSDGQIEASGGETTEP